MAMMRASPGLYKGVCLKQIFLSNPIIFPPKNHSKLHQRPMAHNLLASLSVCNFTRVLVPSRDPISFVTSRSGIPRPVQCMPTSKISDSPNILRRSANYQPSIWHYDYIQSLKNEYVVNFVIVFHFSVLSVLVTISNYY
jgi:hypothetical protein